MRWWSDMDHIRLVKKRMAWAVRQERKRTGVLRKECRRVERVCDEGVGWSQGGGKEV